MRIWRLIPLSIVLLLAIGLAGNAAANENSTFVEYGGSAVTDGEYIVWAQRWFEDGEDGTHLFAEKIAMGERLHIVDGDVAPGDVDIENGTVIWSQRKEDSQRTVFGYSLDSGERFEISTVEGHNEAGAISGDVVVWRQMLWHGGNEYSHSIMGRNIQTMDEPVLIREGEITGRLVLDGQRLVWAEQIGTDRAQLLTMLIDETTPTVVADLFRPQTISLSYDISGDLIVYEYALASLTAVNLETGEETSIPVEPYDSGPVTDGRFIFWSGNDRDQSVRRVLRGYDLQTGSQFDVHGTSTDVHAVPSIGNGYVSWHIGTDDHNFREIHLARIEDLLPTSPRSAPVDASPDRTWFPETGHSVVFGFKRFWENSGGLPIFGYPLSNEFDELNSDTGDHLTVQYFERQRFEFHPELRDTPYEVQLGRLGASDAEDRGLLNTDPFQPVASPPATAERCEEFEVTGFFVCDEFLDYWQSKGLNFGDDGVSYRESLALFGYPISLPYFDDDTGLITQYFERARFEFHQDNPDEHRVLLGRLGADLLIDRDW